LATKRQADIHRLAVAGDNHADGLRRWLGAESAPGMRQEQPARTATARQKNIAPQAADESRVEIERLKQPARKKKAKEKVGNAFGATSWYVPPPPPAPVKPPPPPPPAARRCRLPISGFTRRLLVKP